MKFTRLLLVMFLAGWAACFVTPTLIMAAEDMGKEASASRTDFPQNVQLPLKVGVALKVNKLYTINELGNMFQADVDLRFRWQDPRVAFNKADFGADRQEFSGAEAAAMLSKIWTPDIQVSNQSDKPQKEEKGLIIFMDGTVQYNLRLKGNFESTYNLDYFPFDTQRLMVNVTSLKYGSGKVLFEHLEVDDQYSGFESGLYLKGWQPERVNYQASQMKGWNGIPVSHIESALEVKREWTAHLFNIYIPLAILLAVPLIALGAIRQTWLVRIQMLTGAIMAYLTFSFATTIRYPALGVDSSVFHLIEYGFLFYLVVLVILLTVYNEHVYKPFMDRFVAVELHAYMKWSVPVFVVFGITALFLFSFLNLE
ncbi:hypothetical protein [Paenibacillus agricola]|uniref:Neurotransmitter-gated ion-channel ligand-binding domain-containing protein n=1 Tax=Paenibacillus agricola TaxID=2716264 RepID=A0ABX0JEW5_9BACL|nr:hypothetical protein [Paenibacillus agricola]NHN33799.1 hypothetical protein [Paenibacillus agricola]